MEVTFYQVMFSDLNKSLARLLEKVYEGGERAVVMCDSAAQIQTLNTQLWTFSTLVFLPHSCVLDKDMNTSQAISRQPIWITNQLSNPNNATVLAVVNETKYPNTIFKKYIDIFDGNIDGAVDKAQERHQYYLKQGNICKYWIEMGKSKWEMA